MGKKKQGSSIGRTLIKDRFGGRQTHDKDSHLHTSELEDGYDWNRLNMRSVTEENTLDEFLATAQLAGTEFTAERLNVKYVSAEESSGLLSVDEEKKLKKIQKEHHKQLNIPRRPFWDETTTASELDMKERESFLEWRRQLADLQEVEGLIVTPFERNLDFWRQLWRVIERSDILVQIVDARNPLLFRCEDLETYVKEVNTNKLNMILINKADLLTPKQRKIWAEYFDKQGIHVAFWSAVQEMERIKEQETELNHKEDENEDEWSDEESDEEETDSDEENGSDEECEEIAGKCEDSGVISDDAADRITTDNSQPQSSHQDSAAVTDKDTDAKTETSTTDNKGTDCKNNAMLDNQDSDSKAGQVVSESGHSWCNGSDMLNGEELIALFRSIYSGPTFEEGVLTVGMVGYPNVGKSSTVNALIKTKKVAVSATPGRTKHFQTLYLDDSLMLCDCPGLVMPTFVTTKAHMVLHGILPIDQMRDYVPPVALLCQQMRRGVLEQEYGIMLPAPDEGEDPDRPPTAHELLTAYSCMRGYMTHKGIPDFQRAARYVLKDYVNGRLLYCEPPPDVSTEEYGSVRQSERPARRHTAQEVIHQRAILGTNHAQQLDKDFFTKREVKSGTLGAGKLPTDQQNTNNTNTQSYKPWRQKQKGKKEKLRRKFSHLQN